MKPDSMHLDELGLIGDLIKKTEDDVIYVTIGVPFSNIPIMQKVSVFVDRDTDTSITAAKKLRRMVSDNIENYGWVRGTNFTPAELYYEIYGSPTNEVPFAMSFNSPYRKAHADGRTTS